MSDTGAPTKIAVEIPYGIVEYTARFEEPIIEAWEHRNTIIASVLFALKPWGFALDGVEVKSHGDKLSEHGVVFRRTVPPSPPNPARSVAVTLGTIFISAANLDWTEAEDFISAMSAAITAIRESARPRILSQLVGLGMHVQLKSGSVSSTTTPLLSSGATKLLDGQIKAAGMILTREKSSIVVDASAVYSNALFVRIFREHAGTIALPQIAEALRNDEKQLFELLHLEGEL